MISIKYFLDKYLLNKPRKRTLYAIHYGEKSGGFLIFLHEENVGDVYAALFMPGTPEPMYLTKSEVQFELKAGNITPVSKINKEAYEVCRANFIYYAKKNNIYINNKSL